MYQGSKTSSLQPHPPGVVEMSPVLRPLQPVFPVTVSPDRQECEVTPPVRPEPFSPLRAWLPSDASLAIGSLAPGRAPWAVSWERLLMHVDNAPRLPATLGTARVAIVFEIAEAATMALALLTMLEQRVTVCPLDPALSPESIGAAARHLGATAAVVSPSLETAARRSGAFNAVVTVAFDVDVDAPSWNVCEPYPGAQVLPDDDRTDERPALLLRTSGTTGRPKIVPIRADQLVYNARCLAASLELQRTDLSLTAMPFFHIGGLAATLLAPLASGSATVCCAPFDPVGFLRLLQEGTPFGVATWYYAAPTLHKALLLSAPPRAAGAPPLPTHLRLVRSGAAPLPHEDALALRDLFGCPVLPTYSMSECMPVCAVPPSYDLSLPNTVGAPIGPSVRVVSPEEPTKVLPFGAVGEVQIRGFGVIPGYLARGDDPSMTVESIDESARFPGGWFATGDLGTMSPEGFVDLRGRTREMVKVGGEQVSLFEIDEAVAGTCSDVVDRAFAFGVPNPFWGEEVAVVAIPKVDTATGRPFNDAVVRNAIATRTRAVLPERFKQPKQITVVPSLDALPRTSVGKIRRAELAAALGLEATDTQVMFTLQRQAATARTVNGVPLGEEEDTSRFPLPCRSLHGLRFLVALWVVQHHVGWLPSDQWNYIRNFTVDMTIFFMLGGFMLAAATKRELHPSERKRFYIQRLGAMHGVFWAAALVTVILMLALLPPGSEYARAPAIYMIGLGMFLVSVGFGFPGPGPGALGPFWFQGVFYILVIFFPAIDTRLRAKENRVLWMLGLGALATVCYVPFLIFGLWFLNFAFFLWLPCFALGVAMWYVFRRTPSDERGNGAVWAVVTDFMTLVMAAILAYAALYGRALDTEQDFERSGRTSDPVTGLLGFGRLATPIVALWVYGLAVGRGLTAWVLSRNLLADYLAPLAYPVYLMHSGVALVFYVAMGAERHPESALNMPERPYPADWWVLPIVIAASMLLGALYRFLNPGVTRVATAYWEKMMNFYFSCCCCACCCPQPDDRNQGPPPPPDTTTAGRLRTTIRGLTGAVAQPTDSIRDMGLDSLGAAALAGALQYEFGADCRVSVGDVASSETVGDLLARLTEQYGDGDDAAATNTTIP